MSPAIAPIIVTPSMDENLLMEIRQAVGSGNGEKRRTARRRAAVCNSIGMDTSLSQPAKPFQLKNDAPFFLFPIPAGGWAGRMESVRPEDDNPEKLHTLDNHEQKSPLPCEGATAALQGGDDAN